MAQKWSWGTVATNLRGGWQEFIELCNRRFRLLEVVLRTIQAELLGWITPEQFGARGDGVTDDTVAVQAAVTAAGAGGVVLFRNTYKTTSAITVTAAGQKWLMLGYLNSRLIKYHTGNAVTIQGAGFEAKGLWIDAAVGVSATYAQGAALRLEANYPVLTDFHIENIDIGLDFPADGGKYGKFDNGLIDPYTQTAGSEGRCIYLRGVDTNAMHRQFTNLTGQGIVDFGSIFDTLMTNCIFRRPVWSSSSSSITLLDNCVWGALNQAMTIDGSNTIVRGCRFAGNVTLAATMGGACAFTDNIQTFGTFTDSTPVNVCMVRHHPLSVNYHMLDKHKVLSGSTTGGVVRTYRRVAPGNADYTWSPIDGVSEIDYTTTLTATRTITLSSANAENSVGGIVRRTAGGAFLLDVGGLAFLAPNEWLAFAWNGSGYYITHSGRFGTGGRLDRGFTLDANTLSGTTQYGLVVDPVTQSDATVNGIGVYGRVQTAATAFTQAVSASVWAANPVQGAGSTITTAYGLLVEGITAGGTNYSIFTNSGRAHFTDNVSIRNVTYIWPAANAVGVLTNDGAGNLSWAAGGSGAPTGASYLTLGLDGTLTAERVLTAGTNISFVDTGPNGTLTINASSGSGNAGTATLSFGVSGSTSATVTVTGQAWVTGTSKIVCSVLDDTRAEDAAIEGLTLCVANRVVGTGFDIIGAPAIGDFMGDVTVAFVGV